MLDLHDLAEGAAANDGEELKVLSGDLLLDGGQSMKEQGRGEDRKTKKNRDSFVHIQEEEGRKKKMKRGREGKEKKKRNQARTSAELPKLPQPFPVPGPEVHLIK